MTANRETSSAAQRTVIGLDIGGTKIAAVALSDEVISATVAPSPRTIRCATPKDPSGLIRETVVLAQSALRSLAPTGAELVGVGVSLAGFIGPDGIARQSPNVPGAVDADLPGALRAEFGVEVTVDNDANCAAWTARRFDAPDEPHVVVVAIGTGIGGGIIVGGNLVRGAHGFAGEPGHMVVDPSGPPCPCGQRGCWETLASGSALDAIARRVIGPEANGPFLFERARSGDPGAEAGLREYSRWVAIGIANLINLLDPSSVLISGGITEQGDEFLTRVQRALDDLPTVGGGRSVGLRCVGAGPDASAVGAALLAVPRR